MRILVGRTARGPHDIELALPVPAVPVDYLAARGIPEEWQHDCEVFGWARDGAGRPSPIPGAPIDLAVGWPNSPRTVEELARAARLGMGLYLKLQDRFDLYELVDVLKVARSVRIAETTSYGWQVLAESRVQQLATGEPSEMLPAMPVLEQYIGFGANSVGALQSPRLRQVVIDLTGQRWPHSAEIGAPLERMQLINPTKFPGLHVLHHLGVLRVLRIHHLAELDLLPLKHATSLEAVDLSRVRRIWNRHVLDDLPNLREVNLE